MGAYNILRQVKNARKINPKDIIDLVKACRSEAQVYLTQWVSALCK